MRAITVGERAGGDTVTLTGTVQAETEVNLSFRIDGRMIERMVQVGDAVRAGPGHRAARPAERGERAAGRAGPVAAAQARLVEARNNFARMRDLIADNAVSRAQFDQAEAALQTAESQRRVRAVAGHARAEPPGLHALVSDVAGVVTLAGAEPGEVVGAGRMIVQVAREGARDAVFDVPARVKDAAPANPEHHGRR